MDCVIEVFWEGRMFGRWNDSYTTQATANSAAREDVRNQIGVWQRRGFWEHIDPDLRDLYELLSGNPGPIINLLALDWTSAFALHFWYTFRAFSFPTSLHVNQCLILKV